MGVKGLQSYMENRCPEACRQVSILEMANYHRRVNDIQKPLLLIDGMCVIRHLYAPKLEWVFGGQWRQFVEIFQEFVNSFRRVDIELMFYFDGPTHSSKMSEWALRRRKDMKEISAMFARMAEDHRPPPESQFQLPAAMGIFTRYVAKLACRCSTYTSILEADQEMAIVARQRADCFAILSQDSDFLIFDTKPYLSINHLSLDTMTTVFYDRDLLARHFGLHTAQLPLFSCLMGNDFVPVSQIQQFHRLITERPELRNLAATEVAPKVAQVIRQYDWTGAVQELSTIARVVFQDETKWPLLRDGMDVYGLLVDPNVTADPRYFEHVLCSSALFQWARHRHIVCELPPIILPVLCRQDYSSSSTLENQELTGLPPASDVLSPIRRRMYTILLQGVRCNRDGTPMVQISEWCARPGNPLYQPDLINPLPLNLPELPSLELLWVESQDVRVKRIRWETFLACMGLRLTPDDLQAVRPQFVVTCCLLNYLLLALPAESLASWEVAAFVAQAVSPLAQNVATLYQLQVSYVDCRAVQLASLFMRGVSAVIAASATCGHPFPLEAGLPWHFFDGKLFHCLYLLAKQGATPATLCENQTEALMEFHHLFLVATVGTHLQRG